MPVAYACTGFQPIRWSKDDTRETQVQIIAHNAAWRSLCEAKP